MVMIPSPGRKKEKAILPVFRGKKNNKKKEHKNKPHRHSYFLKDKVKPYKLNCNL